MTNTINVNVDVVDTWTLGVTGPLSGVFTMTRTGQHCVHDVLPAPGLVGHRYSSGVIPFVLGTGESLYFKSSTKTTAVITED